MIHGIDVQNYKPVMVRVMVNFGLDYNISIFSVVTESMGRILW